MDAQQYNLYIADGYFYIMLTPHAPHYQLVTVTTATPPSQLRQRFTEFDVYFAVNRKHITPITYSVCDDAGTTEVFTATITHEFTPSDIFSECDDTSRFDTAAKLLGDNWSETHYLVRAIMYAEK
jgi:hypothetical protein